MGLPSSFSVGAVSSVLWPVCVPLRGGRIVSVKPVVEEVEEQVSYPNEGWLG